MKNKLIIALACLAFSVNGFGQSSVATATTSEEQAVTTLSPLSGTLLDFLKCIKMENISSTWTSSSNAWIAKAIAAKSPKDAAALLTELSGVIAPAAFTSDFQSKKAKWSKGTERISSMPDLKSSMKNFASGFNSSAFIPEFNMTEWTARVDAL